MITINHRNNIVRKYANTINQRTKLAINPRVSTQTVHPIVIFNKQHVIENDIKDIVYDINYWRKEWGL